MDNIINLNKNLFVKTQYERVIDTSFSQLVNISSSNENTSSISINDFFNNYNELFFLIPKFGDINSHEYIIKQSSEYINYFNNDENIVALTEEINNLRRENLELQKQILNSQIK